MIVFQNRIVLYAEYFFLLQNYKIFFDFFCKGGVGEVSGPVGDDLRAQR